MKPAISEARKTELLLDDVAIRCFRDIGDGDYLSARMAYRAGLIGQFLWGSQQAIEKYLKCVLLLNRIPATKVRHSLAAALEKIIDPGKITLGLSPPTKDFIEHIDAYGRFRYLETSPFSFGNDIVKLDRTVWELRRFCTQDESLREIILRDGFPAPKVEIEGGYLEKIVNDPKSPAREPLLLHNGFFGNRIRRKVRTSGGFTAINSPLFLNPQIIDEVSKYIFLPDDIKTAYRQEAQRRLNPAAPKANAQVPPP